MCFLPKKALFFLKDIMNNFSIKRLIFCLALVSIVYTDAISAHIAQDLELDKIFESIDRTHTAHGKKTLQKLLASPVTDVKVLRDRQSAISYLVDHSVKHKQIIVALEQVSKHEQIFDSTLEQNSAVENASLQQFYFSSDMFKQWNESPIGLELGQIAHFANLMSSSVQHGLALLIFNWGMGKKHVCPSHPKEHDHDKKKKCTDGDHHGHPKNNNVKYIKTLFNFWHTMAFFQDLYSVFTTTCNEMHVIKELQQQLMTVAHGIHAIRTVHTLLHDHSEITSHLLLHKHLDAICIQADVSDKLDRLLKLLNTQTFKGKPSVFSRIGNVLAAYTLLQEVAEELQPALQAIGEIDACSSCAQLLAEHQCGPLRYSFAQYEVNQTTPHIHTHNFWHPLINAADATVNSLSLGINDHARNVVLTGPNECGKSTTLKSLTLCAYLAQTLSIVPAEQHCQTIFKEIYSSMVIADQLQQGRSLFVTELENAHALLQRITLLAPGECIFVALDELFKSTQHEKGQKVAYQLLKKTSCVPTRYNHSYYPF